jgi:hypothetical protein
MQWLAEGGYWKGKMPGWLDGWIDRKVSEGRNERDVHTFARAVQDGGCTTAEALAVMRDYDCLHLGSGFETISLDELPDRWFRNAWVRSHNGGPICVNMRKAKRIHFSRIASSAKKHSVSIQSARWRERVRRSSSPEELRNIWPSGLKL